MTVRIGTSGWVYNHWKDIYYPKGLPSGEWFAHYASEFDTVEINNSFYRLPTAATFEAWRRQAPPGFVYAVKASRYLTHLKKLKDPQEPLQRFFERANFLGPTLGPVLYQLPPHWRVNPERLKAFLSALPKGAQHVVEFRDASWLTDDVFRAMQAHGVAHCIHDMYTLDVPMRITAPPVYVRFHGDRQHAGDYPASTLESWASRIASWGKDGMDVYVYFNNDVRGYAPKNARTLKQMLGIK